MDETLEPSGVEKILRVHSGWVPKPAVLAQKISELQRLAIQDDAKAVLESLCEVMPTFRPVTSNNLRQVIHRWQKTNGAMELGVIDRVLASRSK